MKNSGDNMREETITINFVRELKTNSWTIIAFDFPQSGTGMVLHPNDSMSKIEDSYIPDVIAYKNGTGIITENKTHYSEYDIEKLIKLKETNIYSNAIKMAFNNYYVSKILYGVVLMDDASNRDKLLSVRNKIDFSFLYNEKENRIIRFY